MSKGGLINQLVRYYNIPPWMQNLNSEENGAEQTEGTAIHSFTL